MLNSTQVKAVTEDNTEEFVKKNCMKTEMKHFKVVKENPVEYALMK